MRLSVNEAYATEISLLEDITDVIAREVKELATAGASVIQIDEPAILQNPKDIPLLKRMLEEIDENKGEAKLALYTYFGNVSPI
jgi:methionine synthase II (cobalamin-independent)